jgi:hypothetical protein
MLNKGTDILDSCAHGMRQACLSLSLARSSVPLLWIPGEESGHARLPNLSSMNFSRLSRCGALIRSRLK